MAHVLIIDDNRSNINVLGMLLQNEGVSYASVELITTVSDVLENEGPFDLIFLDLEFPTGNGFKLIDKLRERDSLAGVPIIAYSVHVSEIEMARRAGFDGFLGKPLDADIFPDQLQRLLDGQPVWEIVS